MAKKKRFTYKDIKRPDEFISLMEKIFGFFSSYYIWIIGGISLIAVIILASTLISHYGEKKSVAVARDFDMSFSPLMPLTREEMEKEKASEQENAMKEEKAKEEAKDEKKEDGKKEEAQPAEVKKEDDRTAETKKEEKKEEKKTDIREEKIKTALSSLDGFIQNRSSGYIMDIAKIARASIYLSTGDYSKAIGSYNEFLEKHPDSSLKFIIYENIGIAAEKSGNQAEAVQAYEKMASAEDGYARAKALMLLGDIHNPNMKMGKNPDPSKAKEYYEKTLRELSGDEMFLPATQIILKRVVQEKLTFLP
jgi:tetratricopeptide (TPR) repeat protein